ncbi:MAG: ABC transporter permease [Veillonella parvula]
MINLNGIIYCTDVGYACYESGNALDGNIVTRFLFYSLVAFSLGIGLILAAITVKFRDIMHLYSVFTTALMYLTPVIYPMSILTALAYLLL